jgi:hypothetical protein
MLLVPVLLIVVFFNVSAQAATSQVSQPLEVVASNLSNPRGLVFGPDGALYVAEAGMGGDGDCLPNPEGGDPICYGETGAITRIISPTVSPTHTRVVTGLASAAVVTGTGATGPHDLTVDASGNMTVVIGLGADPALRDPSAQLQNLGQLVSVPAGGTWSNWVDVAAFEADENPDGGLVDSNPFSIVTVDDGYLVSDAGANAVLHVSSSGVITTVAVFPARMVEFPPGSGNMVPMESVPTGIVEGPDGAYYVGELTGFPFEVGGANVWRVVPGEEPEVYASGFTSVLDVDFDEDGNLYVLEMTTNGMLSGDPTGALIRVTPGGSRLVVASEGLFMPTGLAIGPDGAAYMTNYSIFPSSEIEGPPTGQVVRVSLVNVGEIHLPLILQQP